MADPYSERFCLVHRPGTPLVTYTVPAGRRAIVKGMSYSAYLATSPVIWLAIADHYIFAASPPGSTFGGALELFQVVYAGERITMEATATAGDVWGSCSGYLLTDAG
jgi:hypothetical protein